MNRATSRQESRALDREIALPGDFSINIQTSLVVRMPSRSAAMPVMNLTSRKPASRPCAAPTKHSP